MCLMVSAVSVWADMVPTLWACGEVEHHGSRRAQKAELLTCGLQEAEAQRGRVPGQNVPVTPQ
jgi:hypothetical protein